MITFYLELIQSTLASFDAKHGFEDIKPIPEFSLISYIVGALLLFALLLGFLYWLGTRQKKEAPAPPPPPPDQVAIARLYELKRQLSENSITTREISSEISLAVRNFLEHALRFPAGEQTVTELEKELSLQLAKELKYSPKEQRVLVRKRLLTLIKQCELLTYAKNPEHLLPSESRDIQGALNEAEQLVRELSYFIREDAKEREEEEKRSASVLEQTRQETSEKLAQ